MFSPQSWTASPGYSRREQLLGIDGKSGEAVSEGEGTVPNERACAETRPSFFKRLHAQVRRLSKRKEKLKVVGRQL